MLWPGSTSLRAEVVKSHERDGTYARDLFTPEHAGTHLDAPAHFAPEGRFADALPAERLVVECALIDVRERCAADPDFTLASADVEAAEERDGPIGPGSAVLLCTGWDAHRADAARYLGGADADELHFPGFGADAAQALIERGVVGIGIDTVEVDPGHDVERSPVHHLTLPAGLWHLEGLVSLAELPRRGALLVVGALKLERGSGAPARVFALV